MEVFEMDYLFLRPISFVILFYNSGYLKSGTQKEGFVKSSLPIKLAIIKKNKQQITAEV